MKTDYVCKDCVACEHSPTGFVCSFDNQSEDVEPNKQHCFKFIPQQYIEALNYDTR
jgi:hypothetical protein